MQKHNAMLTPLILFVFAFSLGIALPACTREIGADGPYGYFNPRFSPDGKLLAFDLCAKKSYCDSVVYDIAAQTYTAYVDQEGRRITTLAFSPNGKRVAFIVRTKGDWPWQDTTQQVAVGSLDDKAFRIVTAGEGVKIVPAFFNVDSVMFWAEVLVKGVGGDYKEKQLHLVDVAGKERRMIVPSKFGFYAPSAPRPMGNGDDIVLSDYGFSQRQLPYVSYEERKKMTSEERKKIDPRSEILLLTKNSQTVTPLKTGLQDSSDPVVALKTGQLFFKGRLESNEGQKGYAYEAYEQEGEGARRITRLRTYMMDMEVASDGKTLALVMASSNWQQQDIPAEQKRSNGRLLLYDIQTHDYRELKPKDVSKVVVHIQN